jgi:hypothetical protein
VWTRRTFHECASELLGISHDFREAQANPGMCSRGGQAAEMAELSTRGVEILRILALAVRSDQDYELTARVRTQVGAVREGATLEQATTTIREYRPPFRALRGYSPLSVRQALNKIAHADPRTAGYFADARAHDLILSGTDEGKQRWIAVVSIPELCEAIRLLPDIRTAGD